MLPMLKRYQIAIKTPKLSQSMVADINKFNKNPHLYNNCLKAKVSSMKNNFSLKYKE